jgi:hypothetical protein
LVFPVIYRLSGDWNNDGLDEIGVFRNGEWYLDMNRKSDWNWTDTNRYWIIGIEWDNPMNGE